MLDELTKTLQAKQYIFFSRYQGLTVSDFGELRRKLDKVSDRTLVVKNSIARKVFKTMGIENASSLIQGSVLLTVGKTEPQVISKVLVEFAKDRENFELNGAYLDGTVCQASYVKSLAKLPSRDVLVATVVSSLNAPVSGFVHVIAQLIQSFAFTLDQVCKQKATVPGSQ
ncbi:MAG: 50S ribosomal protein L10 [Omnitrophica bacterium RIFCSPHIGHO2_02_FULL_49_9]|nr:MAG: 50S ribosomal protein L10 [Omnitrophica bacterium RIFCSPHIGHO2_02_FULL_49_9]OGW88106.1 MAG: 50S ribosomal protein L10 [Omnitrophica bacterium RIFCSPLOWO2_01_FULL_50_24]